MASGVIAVRTCLVLGLGIRLRTLYASQILATKGHGAERVGSSTLRAKSGSHIWG